MTRESSEKRDLAAWAAEAARVEAQTSNDSAASRVARARNGHEVVMGLPVSIFLVALGAILAFAVNRSPNGLNIHVVGWILMIVGFLGLLLSLVWWDRLGFGGRQRPAGYVDEGAVYRRRWVPSYPRRRTVVEEVDEAPPGPPPGPPVP